MNESAWLKELINILCERTKGVTPELAYYLYDDASGDECEEDYCQECAKAKASTLGFRVVYIGWSQSDHERLCDCCGKPLDTHLTDYGVHSVLGKLDDYQTESDMLLVLSAINSAMSCGLLLLDFQQHKPGLQRFLERLKEEGAGNE